MSKVQEIEAAIDALPPDEFLRLRQHVQARFEANWDAEFESDVASGRLDQFAADAIAEHRAGRSTPFPSDAK
jgi:hypothetical protein